MAAAYDYAVYRATFSLFRAPNKNSDVTDQLGISFYPKNPPGTFLFWTVRVFIVENSMHFFRKERLI